MSDKVEFNWAVCTAWLCYSQDYSTRTQYVIMTLCFGIINLSYCSVCTYCHCDNLIFGVYPFSCQHRRRKAEPPSPVRKICFMYGNFYLKFSIHRVTSNKEALHYTNHFHGLIWLPLNRSAEREMPVAFPSETPVAFLGKVWRRSHIHNPNL